MVDSRPAVLNLTSRYDDFLYAPVCEQTNGTQLSVLSALARMDVDPWQEATRLAAMPKATAERTLASLLDLVSGRSWNQSEAEVVAARLVRLLPQLEKVQAVTATEIAISEIRAQRLKYWLVWLGIAIAIAMFSPHYQATTTGAGNPAPNSSATIPLRSRTPNSPPSGEHDQPHEDLSGTTVE